MERRKAARVARRDVGTFADQQFGYGELVCERGIDEGRRLVSRPTVDIGTRSQRLLDGGGVSSGNGIE